MRVACCAHEGQLPNSEYGLYRNQAANFRVYRFALTEKHRKRSKFAARMRRQAAKRLKVARVARKIARLRALLFAYFFWSGRKSMPPEARAIANLKKCSLQRETLKIECRALRADGSMWASTPTGGGTRRSRPTRADRVVCPYERRTRRYNVKRGNKPPHVAAGEEQEFWDEHFA